MLDVLPCRLIKRGIAAIRRRYYTRPWPEDVPSVLIGADPTGVERRLREYGDFERPAASYNYRGKVVNLRWPWGLANPYGPGEIHVRARR